MGLDFMKWLAPGAYLAANKGPEFTQNHTAAGMLLGGAGAGLLGGAAMGLAPQVMGAGGTAGALGGAAAIAPALGGALGGAPGGAVMGAKASGLSSLGGAIAQQPAAAARPPVQQPFNPTGSLGSQHPGAVLIGQPVQQPMQQAYSPLAIGGMDTGPSKQPGLIRDAWRTMDNGQPFMDNVRALAARHPMQPSNFTPALEFANAIGTAMSAQGGNEIGEAIGNYNAQTFQSAHDKQNSTGAYAMGQGGAQQQQPMQPQQGAMGGAYGMQQPIGNAFMRQPPPPSLAQTQLGGDPNMGFTIPPVGAGSGLLGGLQELGNARGFNPAVWSDAVGLGQRQANLALNQNQDARIAATFNPELIRAMDQLQYDQGNFNYQRGFLPDFGLNQVGDSLLQTQLPGLAYDANGQLGYQGVPQVDTAYTAPPQADYFTLGNQRFEQMPGMAPRVVATGQAAPNPIWDPPSGTFVFPPTSPSESAAIVPSGLPPRPATGSTLDISPSDANSIRQSIFDQMFGAQIAEKAKTDTYLGDLVMGAAFSGKSIPHGVGEQYLTLEQRKAFYERVRKASQDYQKSRNAAVATMTPETAPEVLYESAPVPQSQDQSAGAIDASKLTGQDAEAYRWATENPTDSRSPAIVQRIKEKIVSQGK
jgi:hypothetical protein